jgi:cytochrome bd-type quinol oxidase subunit 2
VSQRPNDDLRLSANSILNVLIAIGVSVVSWAIRIFGSQGAFGRTPPIIVFVLLCVSVVLLIVSVIFICRERQQWKISSLALVFNVLSIFCNFSTLSEILYVA